VDPHNSNTPFQIRGGSEIGCCAPLTSGYAEIVTLGTCRPLPLPHPFTIRNADSSDIQSGMQWNGPGNEVVVGYQHNASSTFSWFGMKRYAPGCIRARNM